eukprot:gene29359-12444_t
MHGGGMPMMHGGSMPMMPGGGMPGMPGMMPGGGMPMMPGAGMSMFPGGGMPGMPSGYPGMMSLGSGDPRPLEKSQHRSTMVGAHVLEAGARQDMILDEDAGDAAAMLAAAGPSVLEEGMSYTRSRAAELFLRRPHP